MVNELAGADVDVPDSNDGGNDDDVFRVHGWVTDAQGAEVSHADVIVVQERIRQRRRLGAGRTSEEGYYDVRYRPPEDAPGRLLIVVAVELEREALQIESLPTLAAQDLALDLQEQTPDPSELGVLLRTITPVLDGLPLIDVVESAEHRDISFLAQDTGRSSEEITRAALSARLEAAYQLPAAVFYAFLRLSVPTALPNPLLDATHDFTLVDSLVQRIGSLIFALTADTQRRTVQTALDQKLIPISWAGQVERLVADLQARRVTDVLDRPYLLGKGTLSQLLDIARLPADKHQTFAQALTGNTVSMRNFWRTLGDGEHGFTASEASSVQRTLELGAFTKNHLPLVNLLLSRFAAGAYSSLADLARLTAAQWTALVEQAGPPPNVDAAGDTSAAEVFARVVYTRLTRSYPTAALAGRVAVLANVSEGDRAPLARFFANSPSLELTKTNVVTYLENNSETAFQGIEFQQREAVLSHVRSFQRVLRVSASVDTAQLLLESGMDSAARIAQLGRQQFFVKATAAGLTKHEANRVYRAGVQRYAGVVSLLTQLNRDLIGIWPRAIGSLEDLRGPMNDAIRRDRSLATLFGPQDYCAVSDCTSVLSPAAYLCDLLLWLRNHPLMGAFPTALVALLNRRPDLGHLLLNCPNTDVPLPYIDLVNELLENAVSPPTGAPVWSQTTLTAAQLRAVPEYVNADAYVSLAAASYPHTLPYDSALDDLRTVLAQSGVGLRQLREALLPLAGATAAQRRSAAAERFSLNPHGADLIVNVNEVTAPVAWNTGTPDTDLVAVPAFLKSAGISYGQLLELLDVLWVLGAAAPWVLQGVDDTCDLTRETLSPAPLDVGVLDRAHRFLRLWRHTGWSMWELDLLLRSSAVGAGVLDQSALIALSDFATLLELTRLRVDEQLALFQELDLASHRDPDGSVALSAYARIYLDPAGPADSDLQAIANASAVADPVLAHHGDAIQAALQVSADDASVLFALTDGTLTLANLSLVFRVSALATAARLSLADLIRLAPLTAAGSLANALNGPTAAIAFLQQVRDIVTCGFSVDALLYVLTTEASTSQVSDEQLTTTLTAVRTAIQQTRDEIFTSADPAIAVLARELAQLPGFTDPTVVASAVSVVDDTFPGPLAARNTLIAADFGAFMDVSTAQATLAPLAGGLTPDQRQTAVNQRAVAVLTPLATSLTTTRVIASIAGQLQLQPDVAALLLSELDVPTTSTTLLTALTDPTLVAKPGGNYLPITALNFGPQFDAVRLLDKAGTAVRRLHLVREDLSWLLAHATEYGGLDLVRLPVLPAQPAQSIGALLRTSLVVKLDRGFGTSATASIPDLYALIAAVSAGTLASEAAAQATLAAITGWPVTDVTAYATALGLRFPADYQDPHGYDRLRTLAAIGAATGGNAAQMVAWAVPAPDSAVARSALSVLKSHSTESGWLIAAPALMDPIRERRAAALQAHLLAERDGFGNYIYGDTNGLFDHFLIDVEMSSCEVTTRVVQAHAAVQLFVERALMGLEEPNVTIDLTRDDTWTQWKWMKRYRIWEANREVFLYPENWLIESDRASRTQIFRQLEQEVHQNESTVDYLETVALNYIDRLDEIAHIIVTGSCVDPDTGAIHVVGRSVADPPRFSVRSYRDGIWTAWETVGFDIKGLQVVPAVYRRRLCLFWVDVKVTNEPRQSLPAAQQSSSAPSQEVARYVSLGLNFSVFRNKAWTPPQKAKGKLFDIPLLSSDAVSDSRAVESLYSIKIQSPSPSPGYGASLLVDVFRLGGYDVIDFRLPWAEFAVPILDRPMNATHVGRALFDGRFSDLEQRNFPVAISSGFSRMLDHAQAAYGADATPLMPLPEGEADPDLVGEPGLIPQAGAQVTVPMAARTFPLLFTSLAALEQNVGPLLLSGQVPFRLTAPDSELSFDPSTYFFYQDGRRCYFVESVRYYQSGSAWLPVTPSNAASAPFEVRYRFHRFYHPYTRMFWHQLSSGGFPALYEPAVQQTPDAIDPTHADVFSFGSTYQPVSPRVSWGEDNEIVDFGPDAAYSIYNWELFFHTPLYIAERLSQNQQFEDALAWFHYIFDPTRQGGDPTPQRFWITKPLHDLTGPTIVAERINNLLALVNHGDPTAVAQVTRWRQNPFNPFLLADQRPVAYMKRAVMSYLDNLIGWADNLFSTDSREALNEATLLYIVAAEILGPRPVAVQPPQHLDESFDDLAAKLDAFANALVDIENTLPAGGGGGEGGEGPPIPVPQTFYFKAPPNAKLLGYWTTVADRLFKLRHCQNIAGVTRELALFDAPIDPGLLVRAQAAGVDLGSVLNDAQSGLSAYRFSTVFPTSVQFCEAVRGYGAALLVALEKRDAESLALLLASNRQQMMSETQQVLQQRIDEAIKQLDALNQTLALHQSVHEDQSTQPFVNAAEATSLTMKGTLLAVTLGVVIAKLVASGAHFVPNFAFGVSGFGGSPAAEVKEGGTNIGDAIAAAGDAGKATAIILDKGGDLAKTIGDFMQRADDAKQKSTEALIQMERARAEIAAAQIRVEMATKELANQQAERERVQHQIDVLIGKFTNAELYDWMVGRLSDTYFQSYRLAYSMAKQTERCYRYELGITDSNFLQFGYWDSLKKGLLAGESLAHDLRRLQASYLQQNERRLEISRHVSLAELDPHALLTLLTTGACDFELPESLFDADYPGHYRRHLTRVSVSVVYPAPARFDNISGTLTMVANSVRISTDLGTGYQRTGGNDNRFIDRYGAVGQQIVLGNGQDDPGLFLSQIEDNLTDPRYLPFEGAGAISGWHLSIPASNNDIDLGTVSDVMIHLFFTAADGGGAFKQSVQAVNVASQPAHGVIVLSGVAEPGWANFLHPTGGGDQTLSLAVTNARFPRWTRGKTIQVTALSAVVASNESGNFVLAPQAPLSTTLVTLTPVAGPTEPKLTSGGVVVAGLAPGTWSFKLREPTATDFRSLTPGRLSDVLLLVTFQAS